MPSERMKVFVLLSLIFVSAVYGGSCGQQKKFCVERDEECPNSDYVSCLVCEKKKTKKQKNKKKKNKKKKNNKKECLSNTYCHTSGSCVSYPDVGSSCNAGNGEPVGGKCQPGANCVANNCRARPNAPGAACLDGITDSCTDDLYCGLSNGAWVCIPRQTRDTAGFIFFVLFLLFCHSTKNAYSEVGATGLCLGSTYKDGTTCKEYRRITQTCDTSSRCYHTMACVGTGVCVPYFSLEEDDNCKHRISGIPEVAGCEEGLYCASSTSTCRPITEAMTAKLGQDCDVDADCKINGAGPTCECNGYEETTEKCTWPKPANNVMSLAPKQCMQQVYSYKDCMVAAKALVTGFSNILESPHDSCEREYACMRSCILSQAPATAHKYESTADHDPEECEYLPSCSADFGLEKAVEAGAGEIAVGMVLTFMVGLLSSLLILL